MGNVRELYIREHYVIREIRENFVSRKFPSTRYMLCHVNCVQNKMAVFRAQTAKFPVSILPYRSLGGPIHIFPVTVTSVYAVADLTGKM